MSEYDDNDRRFPAIDELDCALDASEDELPDTMGLIPMAELNSFPQLVSSICVEEPVSRQTLARCLEGDHALALFALKSLDVDPACLMVEDFHPVGVAVRVLEVAETAGEGLKVTVQGLARIRLEGVSTDDDGAQRARISAWPEFAPRDYRIDHLVLEAKRLFAEVLKLIPGLPVNLFKLNQLLADQPATLADLVMAALPLKPAEKAGYLMVDDLEERYLLLLRHLTLELSNRRLGQAVTERIERSLDRRHREFQLREQIKAMQAELGEEADSDPLSALRAKLDAADLPEAARPAVDRELQRLGSLSPANAEHATVSAWLEWVADLPWSVSSDEAPDLARAREILDRDHHGLDKVKRRLMEFLAVQKLTGSRKAPILCLTGPPGVGKTSLGRSVAEALGRRFVRLSLGGVRDETEIRGHRRTYVGARPGRIIAGLRKAGVNNPVFLLDEIDKLGAGPAGDPGAALLEVLDPEQNDTFTDSYLELPFDLGGVLFIITSNVLDRVPAPLRDRLEVIEVDGYTFDEKMGIARGHLWDKQLERHGMAPGELAITEEALADVVGAYTWESGCRELFRQLGTLIRNRAVAKAEGTPMDPAIGRDEVAEVLGPPRRRGESRERHPQSGVVTGLAWTAGGGDIMFVEAVAMAGRGRVSLTGQLGEVMRESAQAAVSYVRSRAGDWFLSESWFKDRDLHIHLPQGAIPKDGPSAGVALATAVVSLASGLKVRPDVAMTGEITLRGLVLPVGGLKEKLLAARRAGLATVLVPARNRPELSELPAGVTAGLEIVEVETLDEVLERALVSPERIFGGEAFKPEIQPAGDPRAWPQAPNAQPSAPMSAGPLAGGSFEAASPGAESRLGAAALAA